MVNSSAAKKTNATEPGPGFTSFIAAAVIAVGLAGMFAFFYLGPDDKVDFTLDSRINPNTVSLGLLRQLPGIGPKKARAIIEYREQFSAGPAFKSAEDLQNVSGIGPKTAEKIQQWLIFE